MSAMEQTPTIFQLKEDGDFRSHECVELLKQADIDNYDAINVDKTDHIPVL